MQSIFHWLFIFLVGPNVSKIWSGRLKNHRVVLTEGINGPGKPRNCSVAVLNSTSVLLTWKAPLDRRMVTSYWIHYRPLYSDENVQLHVGSHLQYVVKNLDVITYYAFRIVAKDATGHHNYCELFAKTKRDARLAVPLRTYHANKTALIITWRAVNLHNVLVMYRLFMEWQSQSGIRVKLLYEGTQTRCVVQGSFLPYPHRLSVSVIVGSVLNIWVQAANMPTYQTKKALVPVGTGYVTATQRAVTVDSIYISTSISAYGWNFVKLSWNSLKIEKGDVKFRLMYRTGRDTREQVTTNNTALLSDLQQLKRYRITVQAEQNNGTHLFASTEVIITTLDRNECTEIPEACSNGSECVNTKGSYLCRCPQGWTGDGKLCKEWTAVDASVGFCDSNVHANITWEKTLEGETMMAPCPFGTRGVAKRECLTPVPDGHPIWGVPDLSSCISDRMAAITDQLDDLNVDLSQVAEQLVNATAVKWNTQSPLQTGDLMAVVHVIEKISQKSLGDLILSMGEEKIKKIAQAVVKSSSNILDTGTIGSWTYMPKGAMAIEASKLLKGLDAIALYLAKSGNFSEGVVSEAPNVVLSVKSTFDGDPTAHQMPPLSARSKEPSSSVLLPGSVLLLQTTKYNRSGIQYITFVSYRNLNVLMQPHMEERSFAVTENEAEVESIVSEIVSVSISPMEINNFEDPVTLVFRSSQDNPKGTLKDNPKGTLKDNPKGEAHCVYWNMSSNNRFWSEAGCELKARNSSHTMCHCYHLTSFAVLMRVQDMPESKEMAKHQFVLSIISYVGISISIVALFISFLTFTCLRFRNTRLRYFVHANLALTLAVAQIGFLFGIDKTENQIICKIIAAALHYLFLASFCWMALEGVVLYLMLVKIFRTKSKPGRDKTLIFLWGWGIPVIIVGVCAGFFHRGYGTESFCWLSLENHFSWAFVAPVLFICLFNCICLGKTFMVMSKSRRKPQSDSRIEKIRYWSRGCALLSCLLGLTWILGVFVVNEDTIFMAYLFNIFNTLQGLLIFLFHCIGDEKVRAEYLRFVCCQTRAYPYVTGRPWWSKSDSFSRSRTLEDKNGKTRRNTLPSTADYAKTTAERMATQRSNSTAKRGGSIPQDSITRPLELSLLYGTTDNGHFKEKQVQRLQQTEKSTEAENVPPILEPTPHQESMATEQNNHLSEQDSPECTLPDVVLKDSQDCESMV